MKISDFIRTEGIDAEVSPVKKWSDVIVNFVNDEGADDETSFDVENVDTEEGKKELEELFEGFCEENNFPVDTVTGVCVNATADTYEELVEITP